MRSPRRTSSWCTEATASSDGIGARLGPPAVADHEDLRARGDGVDRLPISVRPRPPARRRGRRRPGGVQRHPRERTGQHPIQVLAGEHRRVQAQPAGLRRLVGQQLGPRPSHVVRLITMSSRSESIAGLVTWANRCLKYENSDGPCRSARGARRRRPSSRSAPCRRGPSARSGCPGPRGCSRTRRTTARRARAGAS